MKQNIKISVLYFFAVIIFFQGCAQTVYETNIQTDINDKYDTEFPYKDSSPILSSVAQTIHRISSIAFYEAYIYDFNSKIKLSDIKKDNHEKNAIEKIFFNKTGSGTASVIYSVNRKLALLTCDHIVDYPDTIISYWADEKGYITNFVKSISFKKNENIYAVGLPELGRLSILASDKEVDLALLGITFSVDYPGRFPSLSVPIGRASQLNWGSFVYMFGFPINFKMVSRAIVSRPNLKNNGEFLIDGVVNRGFSGGLVLAVRNGVPNLELVGIIRSVPNDVKYVLRPEPLKDNQEYDPLLPYKGNVFLNMEEKINYGIAKVISTEAINKFLLKNRNKIANRGFSQIQFFNKK